MWKDFFYFSKRERRGILFLIVLIAGVFLGKFLFTPPQATSHPTGEPDMKNKIKETTSNEVDKTKEETGGNYARTSNRKPARNFSSQQDKPAEKRTYYPSAEKSPAPPKQTNYPLTEKFAEGTVIELNESDTIQLMKIPGVGPAFAKRIAGYRNLLGGFYRLEQLQEVYGMYEELYEKITPYLRVDSNRVTFIPVNTASLDKLKSHPYINFYQAKAIIEMRKKKGKLNTISELILLEEFTEEDMNRIRCYLSF
jgi:DNA uptake protein ComE-like DNA-binding protein